MSGTSPASVGPDFTTSPRLPGPRVRSLGLAMLLIPCLLGCSTGVRGSPATPPASGRCATEQIRSPETRRALEQAALEPDAIRCNSRVEWETRLDDHARELVDGIAHLWAASPDAAAKKKAKHHALGYLVRSYFEQAQNHNLGVVALRGRSYLDEKGRRQPLLLFRSGLIVGGKGASSCFRSLIEQGRVRHVFNLYTGTFPFRDLIQAERALARQLGVSYLDAAEAKDGSFRQLVEEEKDYRKNLRLAMERTAALIRAILRPGDQPPRGNLYIHCGGGMHRSGMIFGVIRRCLNGDPLPKIEEEYKRHTAWTSHEQPGGFEPLNLQFLHDFDCSLLRGS